MDFSLLAASIRGLSLTWNKWAFRLRHAMKKPKQGFFVGWTMGFCIWCSWREREEKEMACHLYQIKENTLKNTTLFPLCEAVCALGHHQASMVSSFSSRFMCAFGARPVNKISSLNSWQSVLKLDLYEILFCLPNRLFNAELVDLKLESSSPLTWHCAKEAEILWSISWLRIIMMDLAKLCFIQSL